MTKVAAPAGCAGCCPTPTTRQPAPRGPAKEAAARELPETADQNCCTRA